MKKMHVLDNFHILKVIKKEKPCFVVASEIKNLKLVLFSKDGVIAETTFSTYDDFYINIKSYKIDSWWKRFWRRKFNRKRIANNEKKKISGSSNWNRT